MPNELILIVEDDEKSRKLFRDVLSLNGYRTVETDTAEEGLRLVREQRPALILMDIHLPGMSGIDALQALRKDNATRAIPVVAVTASVMTEQQQQVMHAGFDAMERKPVSVSGLVKTVRTVLDSKATNSA